MLIYTIGVYEAAIQEFLQVSVKDGAVEFNHELEFDLSTFDLPRMARLCMALYTRTHRVSKNQRKTVSNKVGHSTNAQSKQE